MQVVVTGAGTLLGQALLREIVGAGSLVRADGQRMAVHRVLAADRVQPATLFIDERVEYVRGDLARPRFLSRMMGTNTDSIFHLVVSQGTGEGQGGLESGLESGLDSGLAAGQEAAPLPRGAIAANPALDAHARLEQDLERSFDVTRMLIEACAFQALPPRLVYVPQYPGAGADNAICALLASEAGRHGIVQACAVPLPHLGPAKLSESARALIAAHDAAPVRAGP